MCADGTSTMLPPCSCCRFRRYMWQRGLSLYYLGRFAEGAEQFRIDVAVNPNDTGVRWGLRVVGSWGAGECALRAVRNGRLTWLAPAAGWVHGAGRFFGYGCMCSACVVHV